MRYYSEESPEATLSASREDLLTLLDSMPDPVLLFEDTSATEFGPLHEANRAARDRLKEGSGQLPHLASLDLIVAGGQRESAQILQELGEKRKVRFESMQTAVADDDEYFEVSLQKITLRGRRYLMALCRDISENKRLEEELSAYSRRMEELVKTRTRQLVSVNQKLQLALIEKQKHLKTSDEFNITLKKVLEKYKESEDRIKTDLIRKITNKLLPLLTSFKRARSIDRSMIDHIENCLRELLLEESQSKNVIYSNLTAGQTKIAKLVQQGYQAQRIARELNLETCTVNNHIANIRKKLGLKNKKVNLRCFLRDAKFS